MGGKCVGMGRMGGCLLSLRVCVCLCMGVCVSLFRGGGRMTVFLVMGVGVRLCVLGG